MIPRSLLALCAVVATGYAVLCGLVFFAQRSLIYLPQYTRAEAANTDYALRGDGVTLRGWIVNPGKPRAILYFGGNAERIEGNRADLARWFPDHSVYLVAYRGYGASDGKPSATTLLSDALAIHDDVRARHPEAPLAVIGRSLGSGIASHVAGQRQVGKLVLVTPFDSLASVGQGHYPWLPVRWLIRDRYPSTEYLRDFRNPLLILRAGHDAVVPPANTDALIAALPSPPRVVEIAEADHNDIHLHPAFGDALADFVR